MLLLYLTFTCLSYLILLKLIPFNINNLFCDTRYKSTKQTLHIYTETISCIKESHYEVNIFEVNNTIPLIMIKRSEYQVEK